MLAENILLAFHPLRDAAVITGGEPAEQLRGTLHIQWGRIVDACIDEKLAGSDPELVADLLRSFRVTVNASAAFEELMAKLARETDPGKRHELTCDAILTCFSEQKIVLPLRNSAGKQLIDSAFNTVGRIPGIPLYAHLLVEAVSRAAKLGVLSRAAFEYRLRYRRNEFWKLYRIPGLD